MSIIQPSASPTSSHILALYTLPPPYSPLSLLPPTTSWLLTHCIHHTVLSCSYLQPHPLHPSYSPLSILPPATPCSLYIASTILSSVAPTSSHILAPDTLRQSYSPLSFLPPAKPLRLIHCLHHTVLCLPYLQAHPGSLHIAIIILYDGCNVSPLPPATPFPSYTLPPPYYPLLFLPPATSWLLIHCVHHTVLCPSYLQQHPVSLYIASTIQSPVSPTSNHILAPDTLRPPYCPLFLLHPCRTYG